MSGDACYVASSTNMHCNMVHCRLITYNYFLTLRPQHLQLFEPFIEQFGTEFQIVDSNGNALFSNGKSKKSALLKKMKKHWCAQQVKAKQWRASQATNPLQIANGGSGPEVGTQVGQEPGQRKRGRGRPKKNSAGMGSANQQGKENCGSQGEAGPSNQVMQRAPASRHGVHPQQRSAGTGTCMEVGQEGVEALPARHSARSRCKRSRYSGVEFAQGLESEEESGSEENCEGEEEWNSEEEVESEGGSSSDEE